MLLRILYSIGIVLLVEATAMSHVPVVDISAFETGDAETRRGIADHVSKAVEDIGFFTVSGHGGPAHVVENMRKSSWEFFRLPLADKKRLLDDSMSLNRGYTPFASEHNGSSEGVKALPDLREGFIYGPFDRPNDDYHNSPTAGFAYQENIWPESQPDLVKNFMRYYSALEALNRRLLGVFAVALNIDPDFFTDKFDRHASTIRLLHYPEQETKPSPGHLRCGAHTDFGSHTILMSDDSPGGLQVRSNDGEWIDVAPPPGSFVVNIGDLMMVWTNDRWVSNRHRVVNPPVSMAEGSARLSIAFFVHPNHDAPIQCIPTCLSNSEPVRHDPVLAGDYRKMKVTKVTAGL